MRKIIIYVLLLICTSSYSQRQLSQQAINDVVNRASSYFGIPQNDKFRSAVNKYINTYRSSGTSAVMANLSRDLKGREDILLMINRATGSRESLLRTLTSMNVDPKNVKEIADYLFPRPVTKEVSGLKKPAPEDPSVKEEPALEEISVEEMLTPIVWIEPSKKFFDGTKTFCDSLGKWYYKFTIMKSNVLLMKYPAKNNISEDNSTPVAQTKAVINGENIVSARNNPTNYKFENEILYEKAEVKNGWNKYIECAGK